MTEEGEIQIFRALNFIRDNATAYAKAKAERVYLEAYRKSKKALLMRQAEIDGQKTVALMERDAYASPEYLEILNGLRIATEEEERLRWLMVAAQASIDVARTLEASKRAEVKAL